MTGTEERVDLVGTVSGRGAARWGSSLSRLQPFGRGTGLSSVVSSVVFIVGKLCLFAAVGFTYYLGQSWRKIHAIDFPARPIRADGGREGSRETEKLEAFVSIAKSSVFGTEPTTPTAAPTPKPPATSSKLRLVGTNETSGGRRMAIIEDTQKHVQDVLELNDAVFDQGKIVKIEPEAVHIEQNGKIEVLAVKDTDSLGTDGEVSGPPSDDQTDFTVPEEDVTSALANLPQLLSQARAVPYFRNGQSIGMRLFAIRSDSLYEKLGLKNGDIVTAVNEHSLSDPSQALRIFEQLKTERSITVKAERNGKNLDLHYSIR